MPFPWHHCILAQFARLRINHKTIDAPLAESLKRQVVPPGSVCCPPDTDNLEYNPAGKLIEETVKAIDERGNELLVLEKLERGACCLALRSLHGTQSER